VCLTFKQTHRVPSIYTEKSLENYTMLNSLSNHLSVSSFELLYSMNTIQCSDILHTQCSTHTIQCSAILHTQCSTHTIQCSAILRNVFHFLLRYEIIHVALVSLSIAIQKTKHLNDCLVNLASYNFLTTFQCKCWVMHSLGSISAIASEKKKFLYFPDMVLC
jgi:hypothetical protein